MIDNFREKVEKAIDSKIEEYKKDMEKSNPFDEAIFSVMILSLLDLKKEIGLD